MNSIHNVNSLGYNVNNGTTMPPLWLVIATEEGKRLMELETPWWEAFGWEETEQAIIAWAHPHSRKHHDSYLNPWSTWSDGMPKRSKSQSKSKAKWRRIGKM